jgi:adenosylcobinamide-phosphate synthase
MNILIIILFAILIDVLFGELPSKIHPVVLMGYLISFTKKFLIKYNNKSSGIVLTTVILSIFILVFAVIIKISTIYYFLYLIISALLLSTTFAIKSLIDSVKNVREDLKVDIDNAKHSMSYLVSRDTSKLNESDIVSACIETLTENITDSVTAPLIYTYIFGVLGGVFYRVINTLDAMVGYKNPENINIGWFPAKFDDILNYLPARITGILVVIASLLLKLDWKSSYKIMMRDAKKTPSPNSGYPMAAAAGALGIKLNKHGYYKLGDNINPLKIETITETILLTKITIITFLIISSIIYITIIILILNWVNFY